MAQRTSEGQEAGGTLLTIEAGGTLLTIEHRSAYIEQNKIRKSLNTLFQKTVT